MRACPLIGWFVADAGVLTLAHSRPEYIRQARWLAQSIRLRSRDLPLAVATDFDPDLFRDVFDVVIPWRFDRWRGVASKLELFDISPFATTLFVDSDCLCIRSLARVFDYFGAQEFAVYGSNWRNFPWGAGASSCRAIVDSETYPVFNGGAYFFRKSSLAREVFHRAKGFFECYDAVGLRRPHDEPLISLAMASLGLSATAKQDLVVMVAPEAPRYQLDIDLLRGHCSLIRRGMRLEPEIVHFVGGRTEMAAYRRECMVLDRIVGGSWPASARPLLAGEAALTTLVGRVKRRLRRGTRTLARRNDALRRRLNS